jgi:hypothetical protein
MLIQGLQKFYFSKFYSDSFYFNRISLNWICAGDSNDHNGIRLATRDAVNSWNKQQVSLVEWYIDI